MEHKSSLKSIKTPIRNTAEVLSKAYQVPVDVVIGDSTFNPSGSTGHKKRPTSGKRHSARSSDLRWSHAATTI